MLLNQPVISNNNRKPLVDVKNHTFVKFKFLVRSDSNAMSQPIKWIKVKLG